MIPSDPQLGALSDQWLALRAEHELRSLISASGGRLKPRHLVESSAVLTEVIRRVVSPSHTGAAA